MALGAPLRPNPGSKLSETQGNSLDLHTTVIGWLTARRTESVELGPGGRRFKSGLPDQTKAPLRRGFCLELTSNSGLSWH